MADNSQKEAIDADGNVFIMSRKSIKNTKKNRAKSRRSINVKNRPTSSMAASNIKKDAWDFEWQFFSLNRILILE